MAEEHSQVKHPVLARSLALAMAGYWLCIDRSGCVGGVYDISRLCKREIEELLPIRPIRGLRPLENEPAPFYLAVSGIGGPSNWERSPYLALGIFPPFELGRR